MSHIFDEKKFKKLDSPERRKALPVEEVLAALPTTKGSIADVGCGIGYFSFPFAEVFNQVHAIDISQIMLDELKRRSTRDNIQVGLGDFNDLLSDASMDVFFTATVIHELDDLKGFTASAIQKLKDDGYLAYLDFKKIEGTMGPDVDKRIAQESVEELFRDLGLKEIEAHSIKDVFYLVIGKK